MKKKRSKGVTFWGWLLIILGILCILPLKEVQAYRINFLLISLVFSAASLGCGIFILKLNDIARKAVIFLCLCSILFTLIFSKVILKGVSSENIYMHRKQVITEQLEPEDQQKALEELERARKFIPIIPIVFLLIPVLTLQVIPIYFFTRPKVKEQFKRIKNNQ